MTLLFFRLLQIIAEGANGPTTPDADKVFLENNVMVIPVSTHNEHTHTHTEMKTTKVCYIWMLTLETMFTFK